METPRKWTIVIASIAIVNVLLLSAVVYVALEDDEEEWEQPPVAVIGISGSELATSELVDHGSGTASDPYVITGLDAEIVPPFETRYGIYVSDVDDHLIISGSRVHSDYGEHARVFREIIGILVSGSTNVTILDCRFENLTMGVQILRSAVNVSYNTFLSCLGGVVMDKHEYFTISGTKISNNIFQYTDYCVEVLGSWLWANWVDVVMNNNSFGNYLRAVGVYGAGRNFTIVGNYFSEGSEFAIDASVLHESTIADNRMYGQFREGGGILLSSSVDVRIERNSIDTLGTAVGIDGSSEIVVSNNSIGSWASSFRPTQFGVLVEDSDSINVTYNKITYRTVGVMLLSSGTGNWTVWVHHNELKLNSIEALDNSGSENQWDDGIGAGNYWGDYDGPDDNHDGIGDSPYLIDNDSWDNCPLMASPL